MTHRLHSKPYTIKHSQNFIKQASVAKAVVDLMNVDPQIPVLEIGPGNGSLTSLLAAKCERLIAIEQDTQLYTKLVEQFKLQPRVQFINADFLEYQLPPTGSYQVVGNIPFALTADILIKLLTASNPPIYSSLIMQTEAALRLAGPAYHGNPETLFALSLHPWYQLKITKHLSNQDFSPQPKVTAALVEFAQRKQPLVTERESYLDFVAYIFANSNRGLKNSLGKLFTYKQLQIITKQHKLNLNARPSEIKFEMWLALFETYSRYVPTEKQQVTRGASKTTGRLTGLLN